MRRYFLRASKGKRPGGFFVKFLILLLSLGSWVSSALAGQTFKINKDDGSSGMIYFQGNRVFFENLRAGAVNQSMIFDGEGEEPVLYSVNHDRRAYIRLDQLIAVRSKQMKQMMETMAQRLSPEQKELLRTEGGFSISPEVPKALPEIRDTGIDKTVQGKQCRKYEVWSKNERQQEVWVTRQEIETTVIDALRSMAEFYQGLTSGLPHMARILPFPDFRKIDGFPVLILDSSGKTWFEDQGVRDIDPAKFSPPPGYTEQSLLGSPARP